MLCFAIQREAVMKQLVIFASGAGSNAENIILHMQKIERAAVAAIFCNNASAGVLAIANQHEIPSIIFDKEGLADGTVLKSLKSFNPDLIVLAGFLLKFPQSIIEHFPNRIINIHPALLPKYGGKGMYGMNVHRAISQNKEKKTGITIHYIDEHYDEGDIIFQKDIALSGDEPCEEIAAKVRQLEHEHFATVIEKLLLGKN